MGLGVQEVPLVIDPQVRVAYRRHREPGRRRLGGLKTLQDSALETETLTLRFAQRARPGRRVF